MFWDTTSCGPYVNTHNYLHDRKSTKQETSVAGTEPTYFYWDRSWFHVTIEIESGLPNVMLLNKRQDDG
jgi:hypothetical protein